MDGEKKGGDEALAALVSRHVGYEVEIVQVEPCSEAALQRARDAV